MKLLVITQKVDKNDPVLGFFHHWLEKFAKNYEQLIVICLEQGIYDLPQNVKVLSLGKEKGQSKFKYLVRFYYYVWQHRNNYQSVFVHMNQEYVLLAGVWWKLQRKSVYLWRNHPRGNILASLAVLLSTKAFCTSKSAYVARFPKSLIMPVGNDTRLFSPVYGVLRKKGSICMLGRISPIKHLELALGAIKEFVLINNRVSLTIIGSPLVKDKDYYNFLKQYVEENKLSAYVFFEDEVPYNKHPSIFSSYEINLNLTEAGSFDKSILGGTSCGAIPLVTNASLKGLLPEECITEADPKMIANALNKLLNPQLQVKIKKDLENFVKAQSLEILMGKLFREIK